MKQTPSPSADWPHYRAARIAAEALNNAGFEAYIIGGAVRDMLLNITPKDFDLATNARPEDIADIDELRPAQYSDSSQAYGITRVRIDLDKDSSPKEVELEIATYRQDIAAHKGRKHTQVKYSSLEEDIKRRDITINALALDPHTNQIIDYVEGVRDIESKLIRMIGEPKIRIQEDPLRILRSLRLKVQLNFNFEQKTEEALRRAVKTGAVEEIADNRIKIELSNMLMHPTRSKAMVVLDDFGILERLLPEVAATKNVDQPSNIHAEGDVFRHTMLSIEYLPDIVSPRLAWATLLHDIGKAKTFTSVEETGDRIRFSGHHQVGAELADKILKRLGFGVNFRRDVTWMIHYHLSIADLPKMRPRRADNFMHHPAFADLLELLRADAHAAWSKNSHTHQLDTSGPDLSYLEKIWSEFQLRDSRRPPSLKHDLGVDGNWLKENFELSDGPQIASILNALESAYLNHQISNSSEARRLTEQIIKDA